MNKALPYKRYKVTFRYVKPGKNNKPGCLFPFAHNRDDAAKWCKNYLSDPIVILKVELYQEPKG